MPKFFKKVVVTLERAVSIATDSDGQGSSAWHSARSIRITASKARQLITYVSNNTPDWEQKMQSYFNDPFKGNRATNHGIRAESLARKCYERVTGCNVLESGLMINPCVPWMGASLDGFVQNLKEDGSSIINKTVEFKAPVEGKVLTAESVAKKLLYIDSKNGKLKVAHIYHCQVQLGLFITNLKKCDFVIYSTYDDTCHIITETYDESLVLNDYLPKLQLVYFNHALKFLVQNHGKNKKDTTAIDNET